MRMLEGFKSLMWKDRELLAWVARGGVKFSKETMTKARDIGCTRVALMIDEKTKRFAIVQTDNDEDGYRVNGKRAMMTITRKFIARSIINMIDGADKNGCLLTFKGEVDEKEKAIIFSLKAESSKMGG